MPCRYDEGPSDNSDKLNTMQKELDSVTALLCSLCSNLEEHFPSENILWDTPNLKTWWTKHQLSDEVRNQKEILRLKTEKERFDKQIAELTKKRDSLNKELNGKIKKK